MATKFGYVERNIENDVNWGEVGKGFADMLVAEREERQAKKDLLDDAMIKTQDALKEAPLGYNTDFNDRIIGLADNASSYLLAANKDLKAGRITPAEYMRKVQRMNSSADQIFNLSNNYNKLYEEHLNRLDEDISGKVEQQIFEDISNMTNFNENDFFIDSTGAIVAAPLVTDKNGVTTIDPSRAMSAQAMFNLAQNFVNKVDVEAEAKKSADRLATYIVSESQAPDYKNKGRNEIITDIRKRGDYLKLKKSLIDGILSSDLSTSSVLADYIGGYDVVTKRDKLSKDPAEREKQVYIDISNGKEGRAELTESQKKVAEERIGLVLEGMIDSKTMVTETAKREIPVSRLKYWQSIKNADQAKETIATYWNQLGWGNAEEKAKAAQDLISNINVKEQGVLGLQPSADGKELTIIMADSKYTQTIDLTKNYSPEEWAGLGSVLHGEADKNKAAAAGGGWQKGKTYQYQQESVGPMQSGLGGPEMLFIGTESVREGGKPTEDIDVTFREVLDSQFNTDATNLVYVLRGYNIKDVKRNGKNVVIEGVKYDTTNPSAMQSLKTSIINSASKATKESAIKGAIYSPSQTGNIDYSRK
jgi:hypothetical protein